MDLINNELIFVLTILAIIAGLLLLLLIILTVKSGKKNNTLLFLFFVLTIYLFGYAVELQGYPINITLKIIAIEYIGIALAPSLLLLVILDYWGISTEKIKVYQALLFIIPFITILIAFSDRIIPWLYSSAWMANSSGINGFAMIPGIWWYIYCTWNAAMLLICSLILLHVILTKSRLYRNQAILMLIGVSAPLVSIYLNSIVRQTIPIDLTPYAIMITGLSVYPAITRFNLFNIVPIAYASVFKKLGSGLIVLDNLGRIRELNPAFEEIFNVKGSEIIGSDAGTSIPYGNFLVDLSKGNNIKREELKISTSERPEYYFVDVIPFDEDKSTSSGSVIMVTRITDQKEREKQLIEYADIIESRRVDLNIAYDEKNTAYDLLKLNQQALSDSERSLRRAEALAHLGIYEWDVNSGKVSASDEFKRIIGIRNADPLPGYFDFINYILPSEREHVSALIKKNLDTCKSFTTDFSIIRPDETVRKIRSMNESEFDENGLLTHTTLIIQDITEEEKMLDEISEVHNENRILISEIHHRVKNNLQVISSLLSMQSRTIDDPVTLSLFKEAQARIKSIALVHEQIYNSSNFNKIKYRDYILKMTAYLFSLYNVSHDKIRCLNNVEPIEISVEIAVPLSLIITELITNSIKYAFDDNKTGEIEIIMILDHKKNMYILDYSDDGSGFPDDSDPNTGKGFGSTLIIGLTKQISGNIDVNSNHKGVHYHIEFPVV